MHTRTNMSLIGLPTVGVAALVAWVSSGRADVPLFVLVFLSLAEAGLLAAVVGVL